MYHNRRGFTLIELMVAVAIVGILSAIAYPSYLEYVYSSRRADATIALLELSHALERYYTENNSYLGAAVGGSGIYPATSPSGYYTMAIATLAANSYGLTATPVGSQANDRCGSFSLQSSQLKAVTGSEPVAECW